MKIFPMPLHRLERGLATIFNDALGPDVTIVWTYGAIPRQITTPTMLTMQMIAGPSEWNRTQRRGVIRTDVTVATLSVDGPIVVGTRYGLRVNRFDYFHDAAGGESLDDIRDAIVALMVAEADPTFTPAATAPVGQLTLSQTAPGSIYAVRRVGPWVVDDIADDGNCVLLTDGTRVMDVSIQVFSKGRNPSAGAWSFSEIAREALVAPDLVDVLRNEGVAIWSKGPAADLSAIAGSDWETRVAFTVRLAMRATFARPVAAIEHVLYRRKFRDLGGNLVIDDTVALI